MKDIDKEIANLFADTIDVEPIYYDFSDKYGEWEIALDLTEEEIEEEDFEPLMNYIYPLPDYFERDMEIKFGKDWRERIKEYLVATTVIYIDEAYFLALTAGGRDLSWEICESYINLGYLPPACFCDLPKMAGKNMKSKRNMRIIKACIRSVQLIQKRALQTEEKLKKLLH